MNKICTDLEQSKKLLELEIGVNTADMCISLFTIITNGNKEINQVLVPLNYSNVTEYPAPDFIERIPAWSLSALLSILPLHLIVNGKVYKFGMSKGFNKNGETYAIKYSIFNTTFYLHLTNFYNNPIDAAFEMICWLKENGKI